MKMNNPILFWGTPEFALLSLEGLLKGGFRVVGVVTNPDEPAGRKQILTPPPVKVLAQKHNIPVYQPENLKNFPQLELPEADLYVVAAYGKIIPKNILEKPRYGVLNIHPSLLPRWRGPSPIQYTILSGDSETGVTIMQMDELMDHGPIIANSKFEILNSKITYRELHDRLAKLGAELLAETLPKYLGGKISPIPQDNSQATFSKILKKDDGRIDWKRPAEEIDRMIRAFNPWPGAWTLAPTGDKIYRVKIEEGEDTEAESAAGSPGFLWQQDTRTLLVKTGQGSIRIRKLTLEGKKPLDGAAFLSGYSHLVNTTFV